jgi:hypothetical protein
MTDALVAKAALGVVRDRGLVFRGPGGMAHVRQKRGGDLLEHGANELPIACFRDRIDCR